VTHLHRQPLEGGNGVEIAHFENLLLLRGRHHAVRDLVLRRVEVVVLDVRPDEEVVRERRRQGRGQRLCADAA